MKLYLVRHGKTTDNKEGRFTSQNHGELSEEGEKHGELVGDLISLVSPSQIKGSSLGRLYQTLLIGAVKAHYIGPIQPDDRLWEVGFGAFTGKTIEEIRAMCGVPDLGEYDDRYMNDCEFRTELVRDFGVEALESIAERRGSFLAEVQQFARDAPDAAMMAGSHGAFLANIMEGVIYGTCGRNIESVEKGGVYPQHHDEASVVTYDKEGGVVQVQLNIPIKELLNPASQ